MSYSIVVWRVPSAYQKIHKMVKILFLGEEKGFEVSWIWVFPDSMWFDYSVKHICLTFIQ